MLCWTTLTCSKELIINIWAGLNVLDWRWLELSSYWNLRWKWIIIVVASGIKISIQQCSRSTFCTHHTISSSTSTNCGCISNWRLGCPSNCVDNTATSCPFSHLRKERSLRCWLISIVITDYPANWVVTTGITEWLEILLTWLIHSLCRRLCSLAWRSGT